MKTSLLRISILGPESTGKSTLARALAVHYGTTWCPEYLRQLCETLGRMPLPTDQRRIVRGQLAGEDAAAAEAKALLFCDTDPVMTGVYACYYFRECPGWLWDVARARRYDLTLLLSPDGVPWVPDPLRDAPQAREELFERCRAFLKEIGRRYVVVEGGWSDRLPAAVRAVDRLRAHG